VIATLCFKAFYGGYISVSQSIRRNIERTSVLEGGTSPVKGTIGTGEHRGLGEGT